MTDSAVNPLETLRQSTELVEESKDRLRHLQVRFDLNLKLLKGGQSFELDREPDYMALDTLDWLAKLLRAGCPNQETLDLLATFFEGVSEAASNSKTAWDESVAIANRVLAHSDNGRPLKLLNRLRAIDTFRSRTMLHKDSEEVAKRAAYNAYFYGTGRTYETDDLKPQKITKGASTVESTVARRAMERTILPILRKANLIAPKPPGRKWKA